jgi:hypothetical protein
MSNIPPAGREGRAPSSSTTHAAPAMLPDSGVIVASRDDGNHGEHARTGVGAEDGESKVGANPAGGADTHLRDLMELECEKHTIVSKSYETAYETFARLLVRCPRCGAPAWETNFLGMPLVACPCVGERIVVMNAPATSTACCLKCHGVFDVTYDRGRCIDCTRWRSWKSPQRGVDFPCEDCGALAGSEVVNGWYRCRTCGYPGQ